MNDFTLLVLGVAGGAVLALTGGYVALVWYFNRHNPM